MTNNSEQRVISLIYPDGVVGASSEIFGVNPPKRSVTSYFSFPVEFTREQIITACGRDMVIAHKDGKEEILAKLCYEVARQITPPGEPVVHALIMIDGDRVQTMHLHGSMPPAEAAKVFSAKLDEIESSVS